MPMTRPAIRPRSRRWVTARCATSGLLRGRSRFLSYPLPFVGEGAERTSVSEAGEGESFAQSPLTRLALRYRSRASHPLPQGERERERPAPPISPLQLLREQHQRLAIDLGVVPFAHGVEIRRALAVGMAGLPAIDLEQIGGGGQHVRHRVAQVDMAVAVIVDAVLDVGRRQKMRL